MENETEAVIDVFVTLSFSLLVVITPFSSRLSVILRHYCLSLSVCPIQSALSLSLSLSLTHTHTHTHSHINRELSLAYRDPLLL